MATDIGMQYGYKTRPTGFLNSILVYTMKMTVKTLVSVAQGCKTELGTRNKWKVTDHLRFMVMIMTCLTVWVLRVSMDQIPIFNNSPYYHLDEELSSIRSLPSSALPSSSGSSLKLVPYGGGDRPCFKALGRALTQVLLILNEIPATSTKYQFIMTMADKIMDGNARAGHVELLEINRTALSAAFARTSGLLYHSLRSTPSQEEETSWTRRAIKALPLGSLIAPGLSLCFKMMMSWIDATTHMVQKRKELGLIGVVEEYGEVVAEKLAQELFWITNKLRAYGGVDQALVEWSYLSGLASLSLTASPRVQGLIVRISAILFGDLSVVNYDVPREVKYRILVHWLPLFCHANNGLAYPFLTTLEKIEIEKGIDQVIWSLSAADQEVILSNWVQDFAVAGSQWPNLQPSYDRWCQFARQHGI